MTRFPAKILYQIRWATNKAMDILDRMVCSIIVYIRFCWWNNYTAWSCRSSYVWYPFSHDNNPWNGTVVSKFGGCLILINPRAKQREHVATLGISRDSTKSRFGVLLNEKSSPKKPMTIQYLQVTLKRKLMAFRKPSKMGHLEEDSEVGHYFQILTVKGYKSGDGGHILPGKIANNPTEILGLSSF